MSINQRKGPAVKTTVHKTIVWLIKIYTITNARRVLLTRQLT